MTLAIYLFLPAYAEEGAYLIIIRPISGQTFHNIRSLNVEFKSNIRPQAAVFKLWEDNKEVDAKQARNQFTLNDPDRGTHLLEVRAYSQEGRLIAQSQIITIYIYQARLRRLSA